MSSLETALRTALGKGDISSPAFRRKVYEAAANAMHKTLEAKGSAPHSAFDDQKTRLAAAIRTIEADLTAQQVAPEVKSEPLTPTNNTTTSSEIYQSRIDPPLGDTLAEKPYTAPKPNTDNHFYAEPRLEEKETVKPIWPEEKLDKPKGFHRAPFARLLTGSVAIALLGIGLLWALATGAFQNQEERDTSVPNPEVVLESESFEGRDPGTAVAPATLDAIEDSASQWVTLFSPKDPTTLGLVGGAAASVQSDPSGDFAKLTTPNANAEVQIDIPLNVLRQAPGRVLQLSLEARSDEGTPTQMSVTCDLGTLAKCSRVRFNVGQAKNEFLLQVPVASDARTTSTGMIKIKTDIETGLRAVKLLAARVRLLDN